MVAFFLGSQAGATYESQAGPPNYPVRSCLLDVQSRLTINGIFGLSWLVWKGRCDGGNWCGIGWSDSLCDSDSWVAAVEQIVDCGVGYGLSRDSSSLANGGIFGGGLGQDSLLDGGGGIISLFDIAA